MQNGDNKDKMVSGTSVKKKEKRRKKEITNVSQVRYENQDCLATAVQKKKDSLMCGKQRTGRAATERWLDGTCRRDTGT